MLLIFYFNVGCWLHGVCVGVHVFQLWTIQFTNHQSVGSVGLFTIMPQTLCVFYKAEVRDDNRYYLHFTNLRWEMATGILLCLYSDSLWAVMLAFYFVYLLLQYLEIEYVVQLHVL